MRPQKHLLKKDAACPRKYYILLQPKLSLAESAQCLGLREKLQSSNAHGVLQFPQLAFMLISKTRLLLAFAFEG